MIIILVSAFVYILLKTKKLLKSIAVIPILYSVIFFFVATPYYKKYLVEGLKSLKIISSSSWLSYELYFLLLLILASILLLLAYKKALLKAVVNSIRPLRLIHFWLMFLGGFALGLSGSSTADSNLKLFSAANSFDIVFCLLSIMFLWMFSVITNDIFDRKDDKLSAREKPLAKGEITSKEAIFISFVLLIFGLLSALLVDYKMLILMMIFTSLYWNYSSPLIRLKRFPFIATFIIALASLALLIAGLILSGDRITELPLNVALTVLVCFTLSFNAKDIKDIEADKAAGIKTVSILWGKKITGIFILLSFLAVPLLLGSLNPLFIGTSLIFGLLGYIIATAKKTREKAFFLLYYTYFFAIFILSPWARKSLFR